MLRKNQSTLRFKRVRPRNETDIPPIGAPSWCLNEAALERFNRSKYNIPRYDYDTEDYDDINTNDTDDNNTNDTDDNNENARKRKADVNTSGRGKKTKKSKHKKPKKK